MQILPPKRFQDPNDPKYDPIRFQPWFARLIKRREKIPFLKQAYNAWTCAPPEMTQVQVADSWGIDARELYDYSNFIQGESIFKHMQGMELKTYQYIIDEANSLWMQRGCRESFTSVLEEIAKSFGLNPRAVKELWEVDPLYYPTNYKGENVG